VFSDDSLKNKRNTDAVDVGKGVLVAARVLESKPAALRPFDEVRADIEKMLVQEEAAVLAERMARRSWLSSSRGTQCLSSGGFPSGQADGAGFPARDPADDLPGSG
jgi:peptidyl-prolyl cis-trans isomerase D